MSGGITQLSRTDLQGRRADLLTKLSAVSVDIEGIRAEMSVKLLGLESEAQKLRTSLGQIDGELSRREAADNIIPTISDHALLRYIERVYGVDIEAMKAALLTPSVITAIKVGASAVKSPVGTMVIKGSTVVTFLDPEMRPKTKTKRGLVEAEVDEYGDEGEAA
jgi:hypothetical protein